LNVPVTRLRSRPGIALAVLVALAAATALLLGRGATPAPADLNPSNMLCKGSIAKGKPDPDDATAGVVDYRFACSQPITGYSVLPDHQATAYETEVFGTDPKTKEVIGADAFSCNGDLPGWGVNCTGATTGNWDVVSAKFDIDGDVCTEPRVDPLIVVTYATKTSSGSVVQYIAGPFDLGRPRGCPKSARGGKTRLPKDNEESTIQPAPVQ
jgi:hypothetical protein